MTDRQSDHPVLQLFLDRWSPRAYDPRPMDEATLMTLFEAARWSPSCFNYQPWRFFYAKREDENWESFLSALAPANQSWVKNASVLVYIASDRTMVIRGERKSSHSHSFDAGAAWMALAMQAASMGLFAHGMTGVDFNVARKLLNLPEDLRLEAAVAIGYPGDKSVLSDTQREREVKSGRKPLSDIVVRGPLFD